MLWFVLFLGFADNKFSHQHHPLTSLCVKGLLWPTMLLWPRIHMIKYSTKTKQPNCIKLLQDSRRKQSLSPARGSSPSSFVTLPSSL